jgi:hypothetical protein
MINLPINRLLFLDIETVGCEPDWESFKKLFVLAQRLF